MNPAIIVLLYPPCSPVQLSLDNFTNAVCPNPILSLSSNAQNFRVKSELDHFLPRAPLPKEFNPRTCSQRWQSRQASPTRYPGSYWIPPTPLSPLFRPFHIPSYHINPSSQLSTSLPLFPLDTHSTFTLLC